MNHLRRISGPILLLLGVPLLVAAQLLLQPLFMILPGPDVLIVALPMRAALELASGFFLGYLAQRNPLLWAATAAALAVLLCNYLAPVTFEPFLLIGSAISAGMHVGLASTFAWTWRQWRSLAGHSSGPLSVSAESKCSPP